MSMRKYIYTLVLAGVMCGAVAQNAGEAFRNANAFFDSINRKMKAEKIDAVFHEMVKQRQFNGIVLASLDTCVVYTNYAGYADYRNRQKLNEGSQYELASVSKQFTAVSILQLYEQGKLKLTDEVSVYLPEFPYAGITVHQLLCHRSGLADYVDYSGGYHKNKDYSFDNDSLLRMIQKYKPKVLARPNAKFEYCNTNYALLALIVERVSGMRMEDYLRQYVWGPAGMEHTFLYGRGLFDAQGYTIGHRAGYKTYTRDFMSVVVGDKAVFSTAEDMYKWNKALYSGHILNDTTLQLAYAPKNKEMAADRNYGYGWRLAQDVHGHAIIYHGGLWNGNNTLFSRRLYDKACVVILSNEFNHSFGGRGDQILEILYAL